MKLTRRIPLKILLLAGALTLALPSLAYAQERGVTVWINGERVDSPESFIANGRTYVEVEAFSRATGVSYRSGDEGHVNVNGVQVEVETVNGKTVAQVRSLAQATGAEDVTWDRTQRRVLIKYRPQLIVYGDVVSLLGGYVQQNRFRVGDVIIFRMTAKHPWTGQLVEEAKLQVHLSTGDVLDMHLGEHPPGSPDGERYWTARYEVTDETPKGILHYYVTAETESMKGEYRPFQVIPSLLTVLEDDPYY